MENKIEEIRIDGSSELAVDILVDLFRPKREEETEEEGNWLSEEDWLEREDD